jgi:hypothetical protein
MNLYNTYYKDWGGGNYKYSFEEVNDYIKVECPK